MNNIPALIIENVAFIAILVICLVSARASFKHHKTLPGADLMFLGFMLYLIYALLAITIPGFMGSYFYDFGHLGKLNTDTFVYFISCLLRLGLILVLIGLCRIGRNLKA